VSYTPREEVYVEAKKKSPVPEVTEDSLFAQEAEASRGETRTITKEEWKREFRITQ